MLKASDIAVGQTYYTFGKRTLSVKKKKWKNNPTDLLALRQGIVYLSEKDIRDELPFFQRLASLDTSTKGYV